MKAIYITETGGPEKLIFGDRPDPEAGTGEVVVRVRASAVNHADLGIRAGRSSTGGLPRILGRKIVRTRLRVRLGSVGSFRAGRGHLTGHSRSSHLPSHQCTWRC